MSEIINKSNLKLTMVSLAGSYKEALEDATNAEDLKPDEEIAFTILLRRKNEIEDSIIQSLNAGKFQQLNRNDFTNKYGANQNDIDFVKHFLEIQGLTVAGSDICKIKRTIKIKGKYANISKVFETNLKTYTVNPAKPKKIRLRSGDIKIPDDLKDIVIGVFGLDDRVSTQKSLDTNNSNNSIQRFYPYDIANFYGFPKTLTGAGQCIGIIELGVCGYAESDLNAYFKTKRINKLNIIDVPVDGFTNAGLTSDSQEVYLDIQIAHCVAPDAKIVVYFAKNDDQGAVNSIYTAIHDQENAPSVISISWGFPEIGWTQQSLIAINNAFKDAALLGITVCAASGDRGSSDQEEKDSNFDKNVHVEFPSSSPYALSCGGTVVEITNSEKVWNEQADGATGGGVSDCFQKPDYQKNVPVPVSISGSNFMGRGIPDISGNVNYKIFYSANFNTPAKGTSAVAPLMAGLIALTNQQFNKNIGFINPIIYAHPEIFRDITQGNNFIENLTKKGFSAQVGWDACSGLGVPIGQKFVDIFKSL